MTKRKHAAKAVTASIPSALTARAINLSSHLDPSGNPSAKNKSKFCKRTDKTVVSDTTASDALDIDDIFQQARHKEQAPVSTKKVGVLAWAWQIVSVVKYNV